MTTERQKKMAERDALICQMYMEKQSLQHIGKQFGLRRQRIKQIVQKAGLWRERSDALDDRDEFLGINISEADKIALRAEALRSGISMSALSADWIKEKLASLKEQSHEPQRPA